MTAAATSVATLPVIRALLDEARRKNYQSGVLGIHAKPEWAGAESFEHQGTTVKVVPCVSALAVHEALRERGDDRWLVVLTDRDDADLGAGIRSHLVWHRLRTPDPWSAVQARFAANGLDPALTTVAGHRDLAIGLLASTPMDGGWPPAPGGVLTRDHALGSVGRRYLGLPLGELDAIAVLVWTAQPDTAALIADLRKMGGDQLTDAVLGWVTEQVGAAGKPVGHLLRNGEGRQAIPLGLVLDVLLSSRAASRSDDVVLAREAMVRLESRTGGAGVARNALEAWAGQATTAVRQVLGDPRTKSLGDRLLVEADTVLGEVQARSLAEGSDLLPTALSARLGRLAAALRNAVGAVGAGEVEGARVPEEELEAVEAAWNAVGDHVLAAEDGRVPAARAAVRLVRWLALDASPAARDLATLHRRHVDVDGWVDSAVNDAAPGVGDADLGAALSAVLAEVQRRRDVHDMDFATALAAHTREDRPGTTEMLQLEGLLQQVVVPLAKQAPVLLLVLDGMSAAVGCEVIESVTGRAADGWIEVLRVGQSRRIGAVSVLPSITEVSRASLLSGELVVGGQDAEQRGYADLARAHGLAGARLFHKKPLDTTQLGFAVAHDVGAAIDDTGRQPLVTCILNTIDDALDRSDPAGTVWTAETIKHLGPLLERARLAGRVVVMTSDHGHIVERRQGQMRSHPVISSGRSRAEGPVGDGELLVSGRRVLLHDGRAVLAVNERLRYGPLKAGYHGGAAPAEVVVPVYFLVPGVVPDGVDLVPASPQEPRWWSGRVTSAAPAPAAPVPAPARGSKRTLPQSQAPTLFDDFEPEAKAVPAPAALVTPLAAATIKSRTYAEQRSVAGRVTVTDQQVQQLLEALLATADRRLSPTAAAIAMGVAPAALRGAVLHAQRLLNVEGYAVLSFDVDGATVVLDEPLLREQFEVTA